MKLYGMTETGLICHTHPNQQERAKLFQMEKSEAIKSNFLFCYRLLYLV